jgi:hypothetical protein
VTSTGSERPRHGEVKTRRSDPDASDKVPRRNIDMPVMLAVCGTGKDGQAGRGATAKSIRQPYRPWRWSISIL